MSNTRNLVVLEESSPADTEQAPKSQKTFNGTTGLGLIIILYLLVGGLAWMIGEGRSSKRNGEIIAELQAFQTASPVTASPVTASRSPIPESTGISKVMPVLVPTEVAATVVTPTPSAAVSPLPTTESYAVEPPPKGKFILIDQDRQRMFAFKDGLEVDRYLISSGIPGSRLTNTPRWTGNVSHYVGTFFSYGGYADNAWYLFRDYVGDILIHGSPYTIQDGKKIYQDLNQLGRTPASHGCIRLAPKAIERLGRWGPKGALVHITPWTGAGPAIFTVDPLSRAKQQ